jgi:hypothetical protein
MRQHLWKDDAPCKDLDTNLFFDVYEDNADTRLMVDALCIACPLAKKCFAVGVSGKEWGVWGGVYIESGQISREFNNHKTKVDWADTWQTLTNDKDIK